MLALPYNGGKGEKLLPNDKKVLPENHLSCPLYRSKKLGSFFNIKDQTKWEHSNELIYLVKSPNRIYSENYLE